MAPYTSVVSRTPSELMFGRSTHPVQCGFGLTIGGGQVFPEVNFTLPPMLVDRSTGNEVLKQYDEMVSSILGRLVELDVPGAVIEFEHAPQMTEDPAIGAGVTRQTKHLMQAAFDKNGLRTALRTTVCDIRDKDRPPRMRSGSATETMFASFRQNAAEGADLLSIESTGGKEVSDRALMEADVPGLLLALGVLAPRDVRFLWNRICAIATTEGVLPAGDTACAFANTAMVLADRGFIPNVLAAVVRAMSAVRSLAAFEEGAVGPSKDCAYEGPVIKAITGCPISMEGKASACAHFSHMGNVASASCDLWSNESVQNVRLLSGSAPEVFTEVLAYDCRLMNEALASGNQDILQSLMIDSDVRKSVHALIISPESSVAVADAIVGEESDFDRTGAAGRTACTIIRTAHESGAIGLPEREIKWLDRIEKALTDFDSEARVLDEAMPNYADHVLAEEYGL